MPRRPTAKQLAKAKETFKAAAITFLVEKGAKPGNFYEYVLDTPAGVLNVNPFDGWIACRFDDLPKGRAFTSDCGRPCNPYSGKWNFIYFDDLDSLDPKVFKADFGFYLDRLLNWKAVAA